MTLADQAIAPRSEWTPDATELARRVRGREIGAVELTEAAIRRAEALQDKLEAIVTPDFDRALDKARQLDRAALPEGPFVGVPFLVKDLSDYVGLPTLLGSRAMRGSRPLETQDDYITAFDEAGFISIGKSATPELGLLATTEPVGFAPTRNPWDPSRSCGGSSGGAAVAVAAGIVPIAHASDGGGSIRMPAANCGLFGLKPSSGRMIKARTPPFPLELAVHHCVSRSVRDSAKLFAVTEDRGPDARFPPVGEVWGPSKRRLRIGWVLRTIQGDEPAGEVARAMQEAMGLIQSLGHQIEETSWPVDGAAYNDDFLPIWASSAAGFVDTLSQARGAQPDSSLIDPFTSALHRVYRKLPAGRMDRSVEALKGAGRAYDAWLARYDLVMSPVLGTPPAPLGWCGPTVPFEELVPRLRCYCGYTTLHNVAGAPSMSVPLHWTDDDLPIGIQFAARAGHERTLFELAYELEEAQPWTARRPGVSVT